MGIIAAVCISEKKGTAKRPVETGRLMVEHGLEHDAHAGNWHRQVSLLSLQKIEDFKKRGALVRFGDFGENLVVDGIDFAALPVGTRLIVKKAGSGGAGESAKNDANGPEDALLEMTQIGKECHSHCAIFHTMGECIMPTQGVFARVLRGGEVRAGDELVICAAAELDAGA